MSANNPNSEVLALLKLVLSEVKTVSSDMQVVKNDVQDLKSWSRVTDNRLANMENKIVDFATELTSLDEKVESRLHDTRPIWQSVLERLDKIEANQENSAKDFQELRSQVLAWLEKLEASQEKLGKDFLEFRQEVLSRFEKLEKDIHFHQRQSRLGFLSYEKDLSLIEERLDRIEAKLEIKN